MQRKRHIHPAMTASDKAMTNHVTGSIVVNGYNYGSISWILQRKDIKRSEAFEMKQDVNASQKNKIRIEKTIEKKEEN